MRSFLHFIISFLYNNDPIHQIQCVASSSSAVVPSNERSRVIFLEKKNFRNKYNESHLLLYSSVQQQRFVLFYSIFHNSSTFGNAKYQVPPTHCGYLIRVVVLFTSNRAAAAFIRKFVLWHRKLPPYYRPCCPTLSSSLPLFG